MCRQICQNGLSPIFTDQQVSLSNYLGEPITRRSRWRWWIRRRPVGQTHLIRANAHLMKNCLRHPETWGNSTAHNGRPDPNSPSRHADNLSMRIDEPTHGYMATITEDEALPKALALMHLKKIPNRKRIRAAN